MMTRAMPHADERPQEEGGHVVLVAIADVAAYAPRFLRWTAKRAKTGKFDLLSPPRLSSDAPDRLSGDLCSLHEGVPRACIACVWCWMPNGQQESAIRSTRADAVACFVALRRGAKDAIDGKYRMTARAFARVCSKAYFARFTPPETAPLPERPSRWTLTCLSGGSTGRVRRDRKVGEL